MKKFIFLSLISIFVISISGCDKSLGETKATVNCNNVSNNPYNVYIDGKYKEVINGKSSKSYKVSTGYHKVRVVQKSGYVVYATDETYDFTAEAGGVYNIYFPEDNFGK